MPITRLAPAVAPDGRVGLRTRCAEVEALLVVSVGPAEKAHGSPSATRALIPARFRLPARRETLPVTHPAWGARFFARAGTLLCWATLAANSAVSGYQPAAAWTALFIGCAAGSFELLVSRRWSAWRSWMTHGGVVLGEISLVLLVLANGSSPTGAVASASIFVWSAAFAGLYLGWRTVLLHIIVLNGLVLLALTHAIGFRDAVLATVTVAQTSTGVAGLCVYIAGSLRRQGEEDALTGLLNRRGLYRRLEQRPRRSRAPWSVAILDLDGFKILNDSRGHEAGDSVLVQASASWTRLLRPGDLLARTGGDEFVLIHPGPVTELTGTVTELRDVIRKVIGVSIGVAAWQDWMSLDQALSAADTAMYRNKQGPRRAARRSSDGDPLSTANNRAVRH